MSLVFDAARLTAQLGELGERKRVAFAAACCERMLPNYSRFVNETSWGDPAALRAALDEVWLHVGGTELSKGRARELEQACQRVTPDSEDFASPYTSAAIDAGAAVCQALECCITPDPRTVAEVAGLARDTIDMHVQRVLDLSYDRPDFESRVATHPLMQREVKSLTADFEALTAIPDFNNETLARFRRDLTTRGSLDDESA